MRCIISRLTSPVPGPAQTVYPFVVTNSADPHAPLARKSQPLALHGNG